MSDTDTPVLSVVIPVYNNPEGIKMTLKSVTNQTYPENDYEIIVVDNGSEDKTRDVVKIYCDQSPELVTLLTEKEIQSSYAARNKGVKHTQGSLIAFIDADMTVGNTWAESVVASFQEHGWDYMGCVIDMYTDSQKSLTSIYNQKFDSFPVEHFLKNRHFTVTACLTVRREVFEEVGLFDERLISGGDFEFGKRVYGAGFEQHFVPRITVRHPARSTPRAWLKRQFRLGRGIAQLQKYHPDKTESGHPLNPVKFLPPHPWHFHAQLVDERELTNHNILSLYLFGYISKLMWAVGGIYEWVKQYRS